jgi:hypothetical protein
MESAQVPINKRVNKENVTMQTMGNYPVIKTNEIMLFSGI